MKKSFEVDYETARDKRGRSQQKIEIDDVDAKKIRDNQTRNSKVPNFVSSR